MPRLITGYIRWVDAINYRLGRIVMYGIFIMVGILLWSSISKTFLLPSLWTLEMAQFAMVSYYILGGPYSIQLGSNVRMDLFYHGWSHRKKAWFDAFTVMVLVFYLGILLYGAFNSLTYSLGHFTGHPFQFAIDLVTAFFTGGPAGAQEVMGYIERSPTAWRPVLWPIKLIMVLGIFLILLQAISEFFKDIARIRGQEI
ncbi:TRAP-type mannitol/chloroaromatic compound transport system, small permease component [Thalassovita gelatinovora]|uniref:TRAP transporter small permease protein n=1 Tax=Thalassovita gelatinovora TaxID=53501 RepID=A0A0P1F903_THAGE|nr:TRAP transporter small permease subunit [Thalassovita gelatinovora]QIZ81275.1 TRAP transporter small permease subunit [Thalassovita gelatinovora]CUH64588.1 TRAP-type mannitol/chloroaromatic compound transport system, small permease component [Thalassovita gelatinovora]SEP95493.1 TRAP-type mannitol/chloroaromatic compound transport system, small permease component [Thalassovita gelatinovora]